MKIIDMHCDTIERLYFLQGEGKGIENLRENQGQLDLMRMQRSGYFLQNFALFIDKALWPDPWEGVLTLWNLYQREVEANGDILRPVFTYEDIVKEDSRMRSLLTVEEGGVCQGDIGKLHKLYELGVRMMTLTWNYGNELGVPATPLDGEDSSHGLTDKGKEFVQEMQRIGMIVDVSHLSDAGFWDMLALAKKPIVASHSNARILCPHGRNLSDEMIAAIGEQGGCVGLNYHKEFLLPYYKYESIWPALIAHAKHIVSKGGIEVLGLGSDFDGIPSNEAIPGVEGVEKLWWKLKEGGFTETDLDKILYKNVLKVYKECL